MLQYLVYACMFATSTLPKLDFKSLLSGLLQATFGPVLPVREMTTSSTVTLQTKRYPSLSDYRSGTRRC